MDFSLLTSNQQEIFTHPLSQQILGKQAYFSYKGKYTYKQKEIIIIFPGAEREIDPPSFSFRIFFLEKL